MLREAGACRCQICNKARALGLGSGSPDVWDTLVGDTAPLAGPEAGAALKAHTELSCFSSSRIRKENEISSKSIKILIAIIPCPAFTN